MIKVDIMGEYADMERDRGINEYLDEIYQIDGDFDEYCDDCAENMCSYVEEPDSVLEFKKIKKETDKAWLLIMSGDAETWFPKSVCTIKDNMITVPKWLLSKIAGWS